MAEIYQAATLGLMSASERNAIIREPEDYFQIVEKGGKSVMQGRFRDSDGWTDIVRFDRDIGMDIAELRARDHTILNNDDKTRPFDELDLDENGWPTSLPVDRAGNDGYVRTTLAWHPEETAGVTGYSGSFYLMAEGSGTIELRHDSLSSDEISNFRAIELDGPTRIAFDYIPDGKQLSLLIHNTDPEESGDYLRNIRVVHEDHLEAYEAGEVFTPEYVDAMQDVRVIRYMSQMEGSDYVPATAGTWEDRIQPDYFTYNTGTDGTDLTSLPIELIVELSNKTGTDPWLSIPVDASDDYVRGMAEYVEANLDPRLKAYVEYGNENWNGIFHSYHYTTGKALETFGELKLRTDANGEVMFDSLGRPYVQEHGVYFDIKEAQDLGFRSLDALAEKMGLSYSLNSSNLAWSDYSAKRATEIAKIFTDVFEDAESGQSETRLDNVLGGQMNFSRIATSMAESKIWREQEPESWIDPLDYFDTLATAAYFGLRATSTDADLVKHWLEGGIEYAAGMIGRNLTLSQNDELDFISFEKETLSASGEVDSARVMRDVSYSSDLAIDLYDAIFLNNEALRNEARSGDAFAAGRDVLVKDVSTHVRLVDEGGKSALQIRAETGNAFQTVLVFDRKLNVSVDQMLEDGTLYVRRLPMMEEEVDTAQAVVADQLGLNLAAYEGGQHFAISLWGVYRQLLNDAEMVELMEHLNTQPMIADAYANWIDAWKDMGGDLFVHFNGIQYPSRYGSWGMLDYVGQQDDPSQDTYKYDVLMEYNAGGPWWDETREEGSFLQGVISYGRAVSEALRGTVEEDILLGGGGDDLLIGGGGADRLHGGAGVDRLYGGDGNDALVLADFSDTIEGGDGVDTMVLSYGLGTIDLSAITGGSIERIGMENGSADLLRVEEEDIARLSDNNTLVVSGESGDMIDLGALERAGSSTIEGETFRIFVDDGNTVVIFVDEDLTLV